MLCALGSPKLGIVGETHLRSLDQQNNICASYKNTAIGISQTVYCSGVAHSHFNTPYHSVQATSKLGRLADWAASSIDNTTVQKW